MTLILVAESRFAPQALEVLGEAGEVELCTDLAARVEEADAVLVALEIPLTRELLDRAGRLRVIATRTSQLRHLDVAEAERRGIAVLSIEAGAPALQQTNSTAEEAIALLLALVRNVPWAFDALKDGRWERRRYGGRELAGKTIGLVGYGRLGRKTAAYAQAFGMHVLATDPHVAIDGDAESRSLDQLLAESDVVSLHCTWSDETRGLIGARELGLMKPDAVLVNTARGEITDEAALLDALESGRLAGAAIDTLAGEQPDGAHLRDNPLVNYARTHENLIVLPHLGGATAEATERTQVYIAERLRDWLNANP
ncbi:MAG TPA: NAD(P)-dependent oxidoreductase [Gaiellaceae bacterium]|nr:NAD(P)-dependent oxidoreductase [Gaiellaceae bacterium]